MSDQTAPADKHDGNGGGTGPSMPPGRNPDEIAKDRSEIESLVSQISARKTRLRLTFPRLKTNITVVTEQTQDMAKHLSMVREDVKTLPAGENKTNLLKHLRECTVKLTNQASTLDDCRAMILGVAKVTNLVFELFKSISAFRRKPEDLLHYDECTPRCPGCTHPERAR